MSRHKDTLLGKVGPGEESLVPMVNLGLGGQNAFRSDLRYFHANTDYVRRNVIAKIIEFPTGFALLPGAKYYQNALKGIVEMYAQSWTGLNKTLTVNSGETAVSGAGEMQQTPTKVTRARSTPTMEIPEKYGLGVQTTFTKWITELIMDPDSQVPGISLRGGQGPTDLLPDVYSMTVLFFEPDPTFTKVQRAWLIGNMYPMSAGEDTGRRDKTQDGETVTLSIEFTGLQQVGLGVNQFAQKILDSMNKTGTNPNLAPAFVNTVDPTVAAAMGYTEQVNKAATEYVRP